tara:strand:+ start:861 stop:1091 length:231 start_codon:yes stop_codon:yes gene_type:complete
MPNNNPTRDRYEPPSNMSTDYEKFNFEDLNVDELFWQTNRPEESNPWRKVSVNEGLNLKSQTTHSFQPKTIVFQKI